MQKLVYSASSFFLFVIAPFLLFSGCSRDDIGRHDPIDPDSMLVIFDITGNSPATYALSHDDELSVSEVKLLLFKINNELIDPIPIIGEVVDVVPGEIKVKAKVQRGWYGNIMLLANSKSILDAASLAKGMTYNQVREQLLLNFNDKWVAKKGGANYVDIPMYGETGLVNVKNVDTNNFSVSLTRMLCRVDLAVDVNAQPTFNLTSVRVYNRDVVGMLPAPKEAGKPLMPTTPSKIVGPLIYQGTEITSTGKAIAGEIYLMESLVKGSNDINRLNGATCLVIGGFYTHNGIVSAKELFYRVDFSTSHSATELYPRHYYDLVRSHHYKINIISVSGPGEEKPEVALEKEISFIDVVVTDWGTGGAIDGAVDGQYTLRLSQGEFNLFSQAYIDGSTDNKLTVSSNHPDGWWIEKITDESGAEMPSGGWLSTTLPLKVPQMSDNTFSLLLTENTVPLPRVGYIYINAGPRMQYKLKVTQKGRLFIDKIEWEDYDGETGEKNNDTGTKDENLTSITVTQSNGPTLTSGISGGNVNPGMGIESDITKISVTYKGYVLDVPVDKYTLTESSKTLAITDRSLIAKAIHLYKVRDDLAGNYIQVSDVNLVSYANWTSIGTLTIPFTGSYTGGYATNKFKIYNFTLSGNGQQVGLFGHTDTGAILTDIYIATGSVAASATVGSIVGINRGTISDCTNAVTVTGTVTMVGGICGNNSEGTILRCTNLGAIRSTITGPGGRAVGGICGINTGKIQQSTNSATVAMAGQMYAGGICGLSGGNSEITDCKNLSGGNVSGMIFVGGISGNLSITSTISGCTNAATVTGTSGMVGGICGAAYSEITNCKNLFGGDVKGASSIGGIVGSGDNAISNCTNAATVTGTGDFVGGIVGKYMSINLMLTDCHNESGGNVSGVANVGGICGSNGDSVNPVYSGSTILRCTNAATVEGTGSYIGGICGYALITSEITDCNNLSGGDVSGTTYVGGICGSNGYIAANPIISGGPISGCSNAATVEGTGNSVGGICGYNSEAASKIIDCKNLAGGNVSGVLYVGGICGSNNGEISSTVTNGTTNGATVSGTGGGAVGGICGENTGTISDCTNNNTVTGAGSSIAGICGNNSGTNSKITNCKNSIGADVIGAWRVSGICGYNSGGTISGCTNAAIITGTGTGTGDNFGGICGTNSLGTISGNINEGAVTSKGDYIGGICGNNTGAISDNTNKGAVIGNKIVGGIIGQNANVSSKITSCHNEAGGNVSGQESVGGICGNNSGTISSCTNDAIVTAESMNGGGICGNNFTDGKIYACINTKTAAVSGGNNIGGIAGFNYASTVINACYNLASIGTATSRGAIVGKFAITVVNPVDCYFGGNVQASFGNTAGSTRFSDAAWPNVGMTNWSEYSATNLTGYWLSIGKWNGGVNIEYPQLRTTP